MMPGSQSSSLSVTAAAADVAWDIAGAPLDRRRGSIPNPAAFTTSAQHFLYYSDVAADALTVVKFNGATIRNLVYGLP
jgi:hypothetical protein